MNAISAEASPFAAKAGNAVSSSSGRATARPRRQAGLAVEGLARISHETAYKRVYADKEAGGTLYKTLRCCKLRRKRYGTGRQHRGKIRNRVGIEKWH